MHFLTFLVKVINQKQTNDKYVSIVSYLTFYFHFKSFQIPSFSKLTIMSFPQLATNKYMGLQNSNNYNGYINSSGKIIILDSILENFR